MKKHHPSFLIVFAFVFVLLFAVATPAQDVVAGIRLLKGYKFKPTRTVDAVAGTIYKPNGLSIYFEEGTSQGYAADKKHMDQYEWYKEQTINGFNVRIAFIKPNLKTMWEPDKPRSPEFGSIMLVTIPLGRDEYNAINFRGEVLNTQEAVDFLLMISTFNNTE